MPRGRALSDDSRWIILHMSATLDIENIVHHTGIPRRTIERILTEFRNRGTVNRLRLPTELRGGARMLTMEHVQACMHYLKEPDVS